MKVKVSEATNIQLDWLVAKCEDALPASYDDWAQRWPHYSTNWSIGGPIIERELLAPEPELDHNCKCFRWCCRNWTGDGGYLYGPTPLIAAMRCFICSRLGETTDVPDVPEELCE